MTDFTWRATRSGNPNKAWVRDDDGNKLSALMSLKAADGLCVAHNMIVGYLEACRDGAVKAATPSPTAHEVKVEVVLARLEAASFPQAITTWTAHAAWHEAKNRLIKVIREELSGAEGV